MPKPDEQVPPAQVAKLRADYAKRGIPPAILNALPAQASYRAYSNAVKEWARTRPKAP